jgi:2-octaprenyl-6-methoxyphenol hydroxylase
VTTPTGTITLEAADLLVAADGKGSPLRQQADIDTFGWQYWQSCITTVLEPEFPIPHTAYERFWPGGPFAILPLPGNRCQVVWTAPQAEAEALLGTCPKPSLWPPWNSALGLTWGGCDR